MIKINPYDVLQIRRVDFCPPHFATANFARRYNLEEAIDMWIQQNLKGRFFIGQNVELDDNNSYKNVYTIGFEEQKELSYFMLACPHLKYN